MDARFYNTEEIDFEKLATDLENMFRMQGYEVQHVGNNDQMIVQFKKGSDLVALVGMQVALSVTLQRTTGGVVAMLGHQKWIDKAAVGAVGLIGIAFLWPLLITAGAGAVKQAALANQMLAAIDSLVLQQVPGAHAGPIPVTLMPQFQQYWSPPPQQYAQPTPAYVPPTPVYTPPTPAYTPPTQMYTPPPAPAKPRCPTCNTEYESGDTFCSGCGRALTPPKRVCTSCNTEVKAGVAFCPNCGASTFQSTQPQPARPAPKPAAPTYTPPRPETPVYTPPAAPVYTPPRPQTPVYKPTTPAYTPPKPPEPQPYVPPVPKDPPVVPQPSVTLVPGKPKPAAPPTLPPTPHVPVYTPPTSTVPPTVAAQPTPSTPPQPAPTIQARPVSQSGADTNAPWGTLIFSNGKEFTLASERILIGRYDHDLGGVQPEVDLSSMEGSDTVSRGHATIEHIGSTFQLTDLGSTNFTRLNGKRLDANVPTPISDGDTLQFGKISSTFKKA